MAGTGEYYEIKLKRGSYPQFEMTTIGVYGGQVISYSYYTDRQTISIRQYNGLNAESLVKQMCEESDPKWERTI